jgi:hypothetical protein
MMPLDGAVINSRGSEIYVLVDIKNGFRVCSICH